MPWEVTIRQADGTPLGDLAVVRQQIAVSVPAMQFHREPSGPEKIAAARAAGIEFPDVIRQHMEGRPATEQAELDGDGFSVRLYGFDAQPLLAIYAEVRGNGNPVPFLAALCRPNGWVAVDDTSGQPVDLAGPTAAGWESFRAYRDRVIRSIEESSSA
jgi:hypothetical protein